jgi:hypothetical protein
MTMFRGLVVLVTGCIGGYVFGLGFGMVFCSLFWSWFPALYQRLALAIDWWWPISWPHSHLFGLLLAPSVGVMMLAIAWYNSPTEVEALDVALGPVDDQPAPVRPGDTGVTGQPLR